MLALAVPCSSLSRDDFAEARFLALLLSSLYGACLMLSADSFLTLFLGLELCRFRSTCWCCSRIAARESAEAALKYLVLGRRRVGEPPDGRIAALRRQRRRFPRRVHRRARLRDAMALAGVVLVVIAFFLKAAVVPFHAWAPDAYEGASMPVTAYMAAIVKAAVLLAGIRLFAGRR